MAMRRRFRGRRGGPFQKRRLNWVTTSFNESALDLAGGSLFLVMLDAADFAGNVSSRNQPARIKRVIFNGQVAAVPALTTDASDLVALFLAAFTIDADDTDTNIILTSVGSIMQAQRVIYTDVHSWGSMESTGGFVQNCYGPLPHISLDVRLNIVVKPEELLVFALRYGSDVSSTLTASAVSGYSRVLIEQP